MLLPFSNLEFPGTLSTPPFFPDQGHLTFAVASNVSLHSMSSTQLGDLCCCLCRAGFKAPTPHRRQPKMYFCVFVAGLCWPSSPLSHPTTCCSFILYLQPPVRLLPTMPQRPCFSFSLGWNFFIPLPHPERHPLPLA